jgi:hypothetical protein
MIPSQHYLATAAVGAAMLGGAAVPAQAQHKPADVDPTWIEPLPASQSPLFIVTRDVKVRRGRARIVVECPPLAGRCRGVLELSALVPDSRLGSVPVDVTGGERQVIKVPVKRRKRTVPGQVIFRAGEAISSRLVVVHGG